MAAKSFGRTCDGIAPAGAESRPIVTVRPGTLEASLAALPPSTASFVRAAGFAGAAGQMQLLPGEDGLAGCLVGLGEEHSPWSHAALATALPPGTAWHLQPDGSDGEPAALGFLLGAYRYGALSEPKRGPALLAASSVPARARIVAEAFTLARDLINTPANLLGPEELAQATLDLAGRFSSEGRAVTGAGLEAAYPAVAAVGRGSTRPAHVASFTWRGSRARDDAPFVSLCGKGVCFDTGGYDLKPSSAMLRMKKDMGGAALMLALAQAAMALDLPIRLAVRIGCAENMVSGEAMRPMDVLRTRRGLTVEIGNTDAEGRLVLCDLLAEASDERPDLLLDAATLTGAARVALGPDIPALFSNDESLGRALEGEGAASQDPLWMLPMHAGYASWLSSSVADCANVSSKPHAGAIVAALFLNRFVADHVSWAHVDTYAWNDQSRPGRPEGGEAQGLRALLAHLHTITGM